MVVGVVLDRDRVVEALPQLADARLEQTLLVLRRVVLEVLGQVAERARHLDRLDRRLRLRPLELGELGLQGGVLLGGQLLDSRLTHGDRASRVRRKPLAVPSPPDAEAGVGATID